METLKNKKTARIWHKRHEMVLKEWGEICSCYRFMHYKAFLKYREWNLRFTLPIIIISTVTGTANFAQNTFPEHIQPALPSCIGGLNLFAAILTTVAQFLKVSELLESHRVSSIHYGKMARNIKLELALPISERKHHGASMLEHYRSEIDQLIEQSPPIPKVILESFNNKLNISNSSVTRPEISEVNPIELYDSSKEEYLKEEVVKRFKEVVDDPERFHNQQEAITKDLDNLVAQLTKQNEDEIVIEVDSSNGLESPSPPPDTDSIGYEDKETYE
jgi:hypothetical protein